MQPHAQQDAEAAEEDAGDSDEVSTGWLGLTTCQLHSTADKSCWPIQEVDQEAMEEVLGVQLDKEDEDDEDEQEGI